MQNNKTMGWEIKPPRGGAVAAGLTFSTSASCIPRILRDPPSTACENDTVTSECTSAPSLRNTGSDSTCHDEDTPLYHALLPRDCRETSVYFEFIRFYSQLFFSNVRFSQVILCLYLSWGLVVIFLWCAHTGQSRDRDKCVVGHTMQAFTLYLNCNRAGTYCPPLFLFLSHFCSIWIHHIMSTNFPAQMLNSATAGKVWFT